MKIIFINLVKIYRYVVSPLFPPSCRFHPTCSEYSIEAIDKHGILLGLWLSIKRVSKCHPFHPGGFDPVPQNKESKA